jgi:hypothetical protein
MLLMKNWLETRWRLTAIFVYLILFVAISLHNQKPGTRANDLLIPPFMILSFGTLSLAGSGVKTQSPIGFPEGLAESTQFTLALPVSRMKCMAVRLACGLIETTSVAVIAAGMLWALFPAVRAAVTPADFTRAVATTLLWLTGPYCAALLFESLIMEPFSMVLAGWSFISLLWLLHRIAPSVDIIRAFGQASPLLTHRMQWSQMATSAGLSLLLFLGAARIVQKRQY